MCRFFFAHVARSNPLISKIWSSWIVSWALFLFSASFQLAKPCFLPCFPSSQKRFKRQNLQPKICSAPFAGSRADVKIQKDAKSKCCASFPLHYPFKKCPLASILYHSSVFSLCWAFSCVSCPPPHTADVPRSINREMDQQINRGRAKKINRRGERDRDRDKDRDRTGRLREREREKKKENER